MPLIVGLQAGRLVSRFGERALVITGSLLMAAGLGAIAAVAGPHGGYVALVVPMCAFGAGFALAVPAVTRAVTSTVPSADAGTASGAFSTMRQLGGAFGVAILGAVFAGTGGYATPAAFSHGFAVAYSAAAGLAVAGAAAGAVLPGLRRRPAPSTMSEQAQPSWTAREAGQ